MKEKTSETRFRRIRRVVRQAIRGDEQEFTKGSIDPAIVLRRTGEAEHRFSPRQMVLIFLPTFVEIF